MTTLREQTVEMTATAPDEYIEKIFEFVKNLLRSLKDEGHELLVSDYVGTKFKEKVNKK